MGKKRSLQEDVVATVDESVQPKKSKKASLDESNVAAAAEDDNNDTIVVEGNGELPKTRKDLMELPYDQKAQYVSVIAQPLAGKKLAKKLFKVLRKAGKISRKTLLRIGLKDVQLRLRKGEKGIVVFAGDVTPIEIMCHLPIVCEEKKIPYVYVPFRSDISAAIGIRRPALMVLIKKHDDYADLYAECEEAIKELTAQFMAEN